MSECRTWYEGDPILEEYHDHEWCRINPDDDFQFEMLCLEGASIGLSWKTIMHKREAYRAAFHDFKIDACASMTDEELEAALLHDASECYMPDIPRPYKNELPAYREQEDRLLRMIYGKFLGTPLTEEELWEEIEEVDYFIRLPSQYELHEKRIMESFTENCTRGNVANRLWRVLNGRHPYRAFKDAINDAGIANKYYDFRSLTFRRMAEEWCCDHKVRYFTKG